MDVCGEAMRIEHSHLLDLASKAGIKKEHAVAVLDQVCEAAAHLPDAIRNMPIHLSTRNHICAKVANSRTLVGTRG